MGQRRKKRGGFLPGMNSELFFQFVNHVIAPKVGQIGKSLQKRQKRKRQRGGNYIPGLGFLKYSTGRGGRKGVEGLKKDSRFLSDLVGAYLIPKLRKKR